jgi:hypothetical protein
MKNIIKVIGLLILISIKQISFGQNDQKALKKEMKLLADSLVSKMYGKSFLKNNTVWNKSGSCIYTENEFKKEPTFLFRYDVKLDKSHKYEELIEFELDSKGNFIPDVYEEIYGFENVPDNLKGCFRLTLKEAINKAKQLGLKEDKKTKASGVLWWENFKKPELINGQFRFYVTIKTKTIEKIIPKGRSSITTKFEVYSFNPWTGDFIEKKKMKSIYSWEVGIGSQTGLIPDNE